VSSRRLRVCYVVPGHNLVGTVGPSRNVLSLARALSASADVTIAFRHLLEPEAAFGLRTIEIDPGADGMVGEPIHDAAVQGIGVGEFARYLMAIRRFVRHELAGRYDIVLEKSWLLSGHVLALCRQHGIPGLAIENVVAHPAQAAQGNLLKRLRVRAGRTLAGHYLRRAPLVVAETTSLADAIVRVWRVPRERIEVVPLGVDRALFRPQDQSAARARLGLAPAATILTYVGVLDATHDLAPLLQTLKTAAPAGLELHVVGAGPRREAYAAMAASAEAPVRFHGRVPHGEVPTYIAAADLCLAPYDSTAFANGELGYSSMKVPEYLAAGRPVASVHSGRMRELIQDGTSGFLLDNSVEGWQSFLRRLPDRAVLARMGEAAASVRLTSWEDTALAYLSLCERTIRATKSPAG
jgi:glycosyltransferase involved in cell wall biosynthesis